MAVALVSILAQDRVGLVSEIADHLFEAGVNLGDTTFAVLGRRPRDHDRDAGQLVSGFFATEADDGSPCVRGWREPGSDPHAR
jgi:hypothetical protein